MCTWLRSTFVTYKEVHQFGVNNTDSDLREAKKGKCGIAEQKAARRFIRSRDDVKRSNSFS